MTEKRAALRLVLPPFIAAKTLSLLVPVLAVWSSSQAPGFPTGAEVRHAFEQWDAVSYLNLAQHGYPAHNLDQAGYLYAFLPGYPLLVAALALLLRDALISGLLISAAAELVALYYLARLVTLERDARSAGFAAWTLALWPYAFFLTAIYTESVFLACATASLYFTRRGDFTRGCVAATLACAFRVTGLALVPMLLVEHFQRHRLRPRPHLAAILAVPLPFILFALFSRLWAGDFLAYFHAQGSLSFAHSPAWPWSGAHVTWDQVVGSPLPAGLTYIFFLELLFGLLGLVACVTAFVWRRFPLSFAVYCAAVWLMATSISFWRSVPRYELAMFPLVIILADVTERRLSWRPALIAGSAGLMAFGASRYAAGLWLA